MEKQPDRYVQNDRIWNPIEEKWEFRNHQKRQSHQSRGSSDASGNRSIDTWKVFQSILVGVIFFVVFGNLLVGVLNMLMFGIVGF